jgi:glycosyltransferase involved in cell wall biosynthesis
VLWLNGTQLPPDISLNTREQATPVTRSYERIGYLIPEFPAQTHAFFWRELSAIRDLGTEVQIISTRKPDFSAVKHAFVQGASKETHYLHPPGIKAFLYLLFHPVWLMKCLGYLRSLEGSVTHKLKITYFILMAADMLAFCRRRGIGYVHGHSCANTAHILAMASLQGSIEYSLTLHGGMEVYGTNHQHKMRRAKFVSTVTRPLHHEVTEVTGLSPERVPVISMGVDPDIFSYRVKSPDSEQPLRFITVARLSRGKGHTYSLQAMERLKADGLDFEFQIVGGGDLEQEIRDEIASRGLSSRVSLTGTLSEEEIVQQLREADVLLLTSHGLFEAAPVCVMEAMSTGVPTITSIIGGTRDMVTDGMDGYLVSQENVDEIESAMRDLIQNRSKIERLGKAARARAEKDFDYRVQATRLLRCIQEPL